MLVSNKRYEKKCSKKAINKKTAQPNCKSIIFGLGRRKTIRNVSDKNKNDENLRKTSQTDPKRLNNGDNYNKNKAIFRLKVAKIEYLERFPSAGGPFQKLIVVDGQFGHRI